MAGHLQADQFHDGSYLHVSSTQEPAASRRSLLSRPSVVLFFRSAGFPTTSLCFMSRVHICFQPSVTHTRFSACDITAGVSEEWPDLCQELLFLPAGLWLLQVCNVVFVPVLVLVEL